MKPVHMVAVVAIVMCTTAIAMSGEENAEPDMQVETPGNQNIEYVQRQLQEVRRDQLNYEIERDLLREAYSSNLQTVNTIITIVLGVFTVLGYLGLRSIGAVREEFRSELQQIKDVRVKMESRLEDIEKQQVQAQEKLEEVSDLNHQQEGRLKLLEMQERIASLYKKGAYSRALEYIAVGLDAFPNDNMLLEIKCGCMLKLSRFDDARVTMEKILELTPDSTSTALNLCETYLILRMQEEYRALSSKFSSSIQAREHLNWYYDSVILYHGTDDEAFRKHIRKLVGELPEEKGKYINWGFTEFMSAIKSDPASEKKRLMVKTLEVLQGLTEPREVLTILDS